MRTREYLSPLQLSRWEKEPERYYLEYLADTKVGREPQTLPMAVGSAFDVFVKSSLQRRFGRGYIPGTEAEIMLKQVENELYRKELMEEIAPKLLTGYQVSGAYASICGLVGDVTTLEMEYDGKGQLWGIPWVFKPDFLCRTVGSFPVVIDWKVNGYCSNSNTSPEAGYLRCTDGWQGGVHSRDNGATHKLFQPMKFGDILVNGNSSMYEVGQGTRSDWNTQLTIYGLGYWGVDAPPMVVGIDQLACKTVEGIGRVPRIAQHRWLVTRASVQAVKERVERMWEAINSDWVFRFMTKDESRARCDELELQASMGASAFLFG
jgi:hypothetical protein